MKTLLTIIIVLVTSCSTERIYTVKSYSEDHGQWQIEAVPEGKKKSKLFIVDCKPDSVGVRFKASTKDWQVQRQKNFLFR